MADLQEVIFSSDASGHLCSSYVWDPNTGTSLMIYKGGGNAALKTLNLIGSDYVSSVEQTKPLMHVWPLNSSQPVQGLRIVLPGKGNAVAFSPDGKFCAVGFHEKIYLWEVDNGRLLAILSRHYQAVSCLKFTDDGSHFVSSAEDGVVMIWSMSLLASHPHLDVLSQSMAGQHDPLHILSDHSLPVSDMFVGKDGIRGRLVTVSIDRSCRIYEMSSGELLLNVVFDNSLTSVTMDTVEVNLFVGTSVGHIHQYSLKNPPRERDHYLKTIEKSFSFTGHIKAVTCLSASIDGVTLLSGSLDEQILLWHIPSRRKIRIIQHKGSVLNAFFARTPKNLFSTKFNPSIVIKNFHRTQDSADHTIEVLNQTDTNFWNDELILNEITSSGSSARVDIAELESLKNELDRIKKINNELYTYAAHKIITSVVHVNVSNKKRKKKKILVKT